MLPTVCYNAVFISFYIFIQDFAIREVKPLYIWIITVPTVGVQTPFMFATDFYSSRNRSFFTLPVLFFEKIFSKMYLRFCINIAEFKMLAIMVWRAIYWGLEWGCAEDQQNHQHESFWTLLAKSAVRDKMYVVNKDVSFSFRLILADTMCIYANAQLKTHILD